MQSRLWNHNQPHTNNWNHLCSENHHMRRIHGCAASDFSLNVVTSLMQANQCFGQNTISDHPINKIKCSRGSVHFAIIVIPINFDPVKLLIVFLSWLHSLSCIPCRITSHNDTTALILTRCYDLDMIEKSLLSHMLHPFLVLAELMSSQYSLQKYSHLESQGGTIDSTKTHCFATQVLRHHNCTPSITHCWSWLSPAENLI